MLNPLLAGWNGYIDRLSALADNPAIKYRRIAVILTWLHLGFDVYLQQKQHACYARPQPPLELKNHLPRDKFVKAQAYGKDKNRFQLYKMCWDHAIALYMLQSRFLVQTWDLSGSLMARVGFGSQYVITQSLIWMIFLMAPPAILSVPWDWYYDFYLEERHGFNKKTPAIFVTDLVKTWGVFLALLLPIFAGMLKVIELFGKNFVPFLVGFMIIVQLVAQLIYPTFIQPLFNKLTALPAGDLRDKVERLAGSLDFPLKHLYVIDGSKRSSHSNAYFYGLPWSKHIVIFDTLIEKQTTPEIEAVLGHELGHWYYSHPTKMLALAETQLFITFTIFSIFIHNQALYSSFGFDPRLALTSPGGGVQPIMIGLQLFTLLQDPIGLVEKFIMNAQTRRYEYQADEFAVRLGKKKELQQALIKLHVDNLTSPHNDKLYSMYHHSHPTLPERLSAMDEYTGAEPLKLKNKEKKDL